MLLEWSPGCVPSASTPLHTVPHVYTHMNTDAPLPIPLFKSLISSDISQSQVPKSTLEFLENLESEPGEQENHKEKKKAFSISL